MKNSIDIILLDTKYEKNIMPGGMVIDNDNSLKNIQI